MAAIAGKRVRTIQPQPWQAQLIDWDNPITRDMVLCMSHADQAYGFAANSTGAVISTAAYTTGAQSNSPIGTGARAASNILYTPPGGINSTSYSLFAVGTATSAAITQSAIDMDNGGAGRYYQFRLANGKADFIPFNGSAAVTGQATAPVAMTVAEMSRGFTMGATASPTRTAVFQNGKATAATPSGLVAVGTGFAPTVGARQTASQGWNTGSLSLVAAWNRTLTDAEMQSLADNPWQLFRASPRRIWMPRIVSAAYVLQAAAASFLLSATQAALSASRRLVAATGALTSGWTPANLIASRRLPASAGALVLAGGSASIIAARKLAAGAGTYGIQASTAPMVASRRLSAQPGAFVLSPGTVQMVYTPVPGPGGPTYTLTVTVGTFGMLGTPTAMQAHRRLSAGTGAFGLTSTAVALSAGRRLASSAGTFGASGAVAVLRVTRRMTADTSSFVVIGADGQLRYSAQIAYARAPAGSGYAAKSHYNDSRPATTSSGRPAATQRNLR
jgi:hypothetical protein